MPIKNFLPYAILRCVFVVFVLIAPSPILAKQTPAVIKGKIIDANDEVIAFATISIKGTGIGTVADSEGNFAIKTTAIGNQTLEFRYLGYDTKRIAVQLESGKTLQLNVVLQSEEIRTEEVVVSAESNVTRIEQEGFAASSVDLKKYRLKISI